MKTEKKKTLRGSALFTVVAVMAILILFLTGTLALANASNSRAHKSYSISQADYTARAAIRSVRAALDSDTDFAEAMRNLSTTVHPQFTIDDSTMGQIGYWDYDTDPDNPQWEADRITIEPVEGDEGTVWLFDPDDEDEPWKDWHMIRVTATCKVGREEETVSAYIRRRVDTITEEGTPEIPGTPGTDPTEYKIPKNKTGSSNEVKGLQEAGGNSYGNGGTVYGGLGIGLKDNSNKTYRLHNEFHTATGLNFINGSVYYGTGSQEMNIVNNGNVKPASGIVIMGSLVNENNALIKVNYNMKGNYSQGDIPYLYVDEMICSPTHSDFNLVQGNGQPFNVYAGTVYMPEIFNLQADLYLMDEPNEDATYTGHRIMPDGLHRIKGVEEWRQMQPMDPYRYSSDAAYKAEIDDRAARAQVEANLDHTDCPQRAVGKNLIGTSDKDKKLIRWADSTFNRRNDDYTYGGSIYCNGDLELYGATIPGDVRVRGKCIIRGKTTIGGDLVVENYYENAEREANGLGRVSGLTFADGAKKENVSGRIYDIESEATASTKLRDDVERVTDVFPDCKAVENKVIPNTLIEDAEVDVEGKYVYGGAKYDQQPYFENIALSDDGAPTYGVIEPKVITLNPSYRYKTGADGLIIFEGEEGATSPVRTDDVLSFYKKDTEGNYQECEKDEAYGTYYRNKDTGEEVKASEAYVTTYTGAGDLNVTSYRYFDTQGVYPTAMRRENIYGTMVTDLASVRKSLNMDVATGYFDDKVYVRVEPTVPADHIITGSPDSDIIITRPKDGAEWYILRNVELWNNKNILIRDNPDAKIKASNAHYYGGVIRFFIEGNVNMNNGNSIKLEKMPEAFSYKDDFGIEYYTGGDVKDPDDPTKEIVLNEPGKISMNNNSVIVGSIKAPCLKLASTTGQGDKTYAYTTEEGKTVSIKPCVIGNALVDHVEYAQNGFVLAYTRSGNGDSSSNGSSDDDSDYDIITIPGTEGTPETPGEDAPDPVEVATFEWSYYMG